MIKLQTLEQNEVDIIMPRVQDELNARYFYESATSYCLANGYDKAAKYYENEAIQENEHYQRWINFLSDWNVVVPFPVIVAPPSFTSLIDIIEMTYQIEFDLGEAYEADAITMLPICPNIFGIIQDYIKIQNDSVVEANNKVTKAYKYLGIDPNLVLFEQENY